MNHKGPLISTFFFKNGHDSFKVDDSFDYNPLPIHHTLKLDNNISSQQILECMDEQAKPVVVGKLNKVINKYGLECFLKGEAMSIEVTERQSEDIYFASLSNDTIPEGLKIIFPTPLSIYEFFQEPTDNGQILIPSLEMIVIMFRVGRNMRQIPIHLSKKILTNQQKLVRKILALQKEIVDMKSKRQNEGFREINMQMQIESQQVTIQDQKEQIQALKTKIVSLQNNSDRKKPEKIIDENQQLQDKCNIMTSQMEDLLRTKQDLMLRISMLSQENERYRKEKTQAQTTIKNLRDEIESHKFIISDLNGELKESRENVSLLTGYKPKSEVVDQNYGKLLVFEPLQSSINKNCYNYVNNVLTKNNSSFNGTGRLIPCAHSIPKSGRFHYKFINRNVGQHPNFRIGVISRTNLAAETYMNGGDIDAVMYYCYSTDKEIIYEGTTKLEGFNIFRGNLITIVIDRQKKQVEWFVENNFVCLTKFTESMKRAENLYFFVQLWSNGDALEMIAK